MGSGYGLPETVVNDADARAALGGGGTGRHIVFCVLIREKNFKNNPDYNQLSIRCLHPLSGSNNYYRSIKVK